ncbi:MAG: hypothetical protein PWP46_2174 [Fusobacteriaceae bacterium]|jgi:glycosyltransferase involved in cell wall biosynthesis|nr:hypothetical protein [Fusobacteriaceae bacterium]
MKIAIDCRMYGKSGIGTYIREILPYLIDIKNNEYILIGDYLKLRHLEAENVKIINNNTPIFSLKEFICFPSKEINKCDIFYTPNYNIPGNIKVPIYSTIHDVVFLDIDEIVGKIGKFIRKFFLKRALKKSKKVFTVSNFSKERIIYHFKPRIPVEVTYNGISKFIKEYIKDNLEKKNKNYIKEDYIIYVGNIKKHKGIKILLEAYEKAKQKGYKYKLVIVGKFDNMRTKDKEVLNKIKKLISTGDIIFTGYISDQKLLDYIANAEKLVQPSLYEGFGIPPLEALALKVQPIISDIKVFKEIYSEFPVIFFKNGDSNSLYQKLMEGMGKSLDRSYIKEIESKYSYKLIANKLIYEMRES